MIKDPFKLFKSGSWNRIKARALKAPDYKDVELHITRDDFRSWCDSQRHVWEQLRRFNITPSIDRINSNGHYTISNIRIISNIENINRSLKQIAESRKKSIQAIHKHGYSTLSFSSMADANNRGFDRRIISSAIRTGYSYKGYHWRFLSLGK
jgi:hypothetical protein